MSLHNKLVCTLLLCLVGTVSTSFGQYGGVSIPNLQELPVTLSWDKDGIRIVARESSPGSGNLLKLVPSRYLEQIGNDLIRITSNASQAPVIIDLTDYYQQTPYRAAADASSGLVTATKAHISVEMPKLTLADYNEPNSFIVELRNFAEDQKESSQTFLFRGLDIFYVNAAECTKRSSVENRIILDVADCRNVNYIVIEGGLLSVADVEEKIPALCNKYNDRYFLPGQTGAFLCIEDCRNNENEEQVYRHLQHVRDLVTKYNITDYEDAPLSYIGDVILTKKGVGFNVKVIREDKLFDKHDESAEPVTYKFFPWYEFIVLSFEKSGDARRLLITDPYNNMYLYDSQVYFSNVELIQFFSELKDLISERVNKV